MIKINIISIGDIKETFYREALKEYEKRISRFADVTVLKIQEERLPQNPSNSEINKALEKATQIGRARVGKECRSRWSPYH